MISYNLNNIYLSKKSNLRKTSVTDTSLTKLTMFNRVCVRAQTPFKFPTFFFGLKFGLSTTETVRNPIKMTKTDLFLRYQTVRDSRQNRPKRPKTPVISIKSAFLRQNLISKTKNGDFLILHFFNFLHFSIFWCFSFLGGIAKPVTGAVPLFFRFRFYISQLSIIQSTIYFHSHSQEREIYSHA